MTYSPFYEDVSGRTPAKRNLRDQLEAAVEQAIALLDQMDGDPDYEDNADRELDRADYEERLQPLTLNRELVA